MDKRKIEYENLLKDLEYYKNELKEEKRSNRRKLIKNKIKNIETDINFYKKYEIKNPMKKIIKVVNPERKKKRVGRIAKKVHYPKRKRKNALLIQSPFRRIKKADTFKAKTNPIKKIKLTISKLNNQGVNTMAVKNARRCKRRNPAIANPAIVANRKRGAGRRHRNPIEGAGVNFSGNSIKSLLLDGAIVGGSMIAVNWASNYVNTKWLNIENKWLRYLLMLGIGVGGGWLISKANSRVGKGFATGAVALTLWTVANENLDFLKQQKLAVLKGEDDEDALLGQMTLGELMEARDLSNQIIESNQMEGLPIDTIEGSAGFDQPFQGEFDYIHGSADIAQQSAYAY